MEDGFSLKGIAEGAIGGAIGGALSNLNLFGGDAPAVGSPQQIVNVAARQAIGSALTQGVAVVTHLQPRFDWSAVAAAGLSAGGAQALDDGFGIANVAQTPGVTAGVENAATQLVAGSVAKTLVNGKESYAQVAGDAFGNALGNSVVQQTQPTSPTREMKDDDGEEASLGESFNQSEIANIDDTGWDTSDESSDDTSQNSAQTDFLQSEIANENQTGWGTSALDQRADTVTGSNIPGVIPNFVSFYGGLPNFLSAAAEMSGMVGGGAGGFNVAGNAGIAAAAAAAQESSDGVLSSPSSGDATWTDMAQSNYPSYYKFIDGGPAAAGAAGSDEWNNGSQGTAFNANEDGDDGFPVFGSGGEELPLPGGGAFNTSTGSETQQEPQSAAGIYGPWAASSGAGTNTPGSTSNLSSSLYGGVGIYQNDVTTFVQQAFPSTSIGQSPATSGFDISESAGGFMVTSATYSQGGNSTAGSSAATCTSQPFAPNNWGYVGHGGFYNEFATAFNAQSDPNEEPMFAAGYSVLAMATALPAAAEEAVRGVLNVPYASAQIVRSLSQASQECDPIDIGTDLLFATSFGVQGFSGAAGVAAPISGVIDSVGVNAVAGSVENRAISSVTTDSLLNEPSVAASSEVAAEVPGAAAYVGGKYVAGIQPLSNLEVYGTDITRTAADIPAIMAKAGFSADDLSSYNFVVLSNDQYAARAAAMGTDFDAAYGPPRINPTSTYQFNGDIASQTVNGDYRIPVYINPSIMNSDEAIVQTISHEYSEIDALSIDAAKPISGKQFSSLVSPNIMGNLHYEAVQYGDQTLLNFRNSTNSGN